MLHLLTGAHQATLALEEVGLPLKQCSVPQKIVQYICLLLVEPCVPLSIIKDLNIIGMLIKDLNIIERSV